MQPATPRDPPRRALALPGATLSYTDEGTGPVVVGLSGLPGAHHHWRWLATPLFEWARFVRLELPGFGDAHLQGPVRPMSLPARGELITRALEALELKDVHLIGHSMGGMSALETAVQHPRLVSTITLVACPGPTPHSSVRGWRLVSRVFTVAALQRPLARILRGVLQRLGYSVRDMRDEGALRSVIDAAWTDFERHRKNIAEVKVPVLQAWGADDELVPRRFHEALSRERPDWTPLRFEDGGHDVQKFHGVELGEAIRRLASST